MSARLRLTLSYAAFLVTAGLMVAVGIWIVFRVVPNYPLTAANPRDQSAVPTREEILDLIVKGSAITLAALAVIGLAGGWFLAGWILRPLDDISTAARLAASGRLDHRIRLSGRSDEFKALADDFDHMLERLDDAFTSQERFAANASHELRTPLTVTATMLDVARAEQDSELLRRLQQTNARAIALTEALLRLADANAVTATLEPVDLAELVRAVGEDGDLQPAWVSGDPELLTQLVENLVRNAHQHGTGELRIRTAGTTLRIENAGPVLEASERLVEPFLRGAGRTAGGGHGLGLALVERITTVHGGQLTLTPRQGGGLIVEVTLAKP
ncbi:HAMP domain-containing histidine kinase [Solirubrobacter phytolaccae]|uniref:histidine kinase n=1 Tax=Solirubrobacter phytolaccae TaxID=1404360 RepID=A0A9X3N602_9ACTN|nr:HAMP domain-containing sensor histidine kinase [Solirubrobacter phytolaccae]MDA0178914.1 HAMP domain-containing histidine kinase [Solirubrobacter phytolaccae]